MCSTKLSIAIQGARKIESDRAKLALDLGAQFGDIKGIGRSPRISRRTTVTGAPQTTRARTRDLTVAYIKGCPAAPAMLARDQQVVGSGGAMTARPAMMRRSSLNALSRQKRAGIVLISTSPMDFASLTPCSSYIFTVWITARFHMLQIHAIHGEMLQTNVDHQKSPPVRGTVF
eukprot:195161_1